MISKTATNGATTVGSSTTQVLAANGGRIGASFVNDSDEVIYLAFGASAVANQGIRLNASGGAYTMPRDSIYTGSINAICASGSKVLTYVEFTQ